MSAGAANAINNWTAAIKAASEKLGIGVSDMVRVLSLHIFGQVVRKTPVDEGHLRAAWNISLNAPVFIETAGQRGSSDLPQKLGLFPRVHITNGLPYAAVVEYGLWRGIGDKTVQGENPTTGHGVFSRQAPAGMVEVTLVEVQNFIKQIVNN